jgi:transglutaminase-like putative cysteine protease
MWLRVSCNLEMEFTVESPLILLLRPRSDARQWIARDRYAVWPALAIEEYADMYGNPCQRLLAPPGHFQIEVCSDVRLPADPQSANGGAFIPVQDLPSETLMYLAPSRYCESDKLGRLVHDIVVDSAPGHDQVAAITHWIHRRLPYRGDSDPTPVSAVEALERGDGVCRDFAHLGIALCRALSIPARIIVGYLHRLDPMDLHAWFEAYVGGQWVAFDPTRPEMGGGRVHLAHGRDAADVPVFTQFGPPVIPFRMEVAVDEIPGPDR